MEQKPALETSHNKVWLKIGGEAICFSTLAQTIVPLEKSGKLVVEEDWVWK